MSCFSYQFVVNCRQCILFHAYLRSLDIEINIKINIHEILKMNVFDFCFCKNIRKTNLLGISTQNMWWKSKNAMIWNECTNFEYFQIIIRINTIYWTTCRVIYYPQNLFENCQFQTSHCLLIFIQMDLQYFLSKAMLSTFMDRTKKPIEIIIMWMCQAPMSMSVAVTSKLRKIYIYI